MYRKIMYLLCLISFSSALQADKPALILQITVDQLRPDLVTQNIDRFGEGGFRYLVENGTVFTDVQFQHANTMTAAGHATLATGGNARQHGMVANRWYDRASGQEMNSVEDADAPYVNGLQGFGTGRSPSNLIGSTFSDELILATGGKSRAFGVSTKDRGAILTAGHHGEAWWYSTRTGDYVTTEWYRDAVPQWVSDWNAQKMAASYGGRTWNLLQDPSRYRFAERDDRSYEWPRGGMGNTFPHRMAGLDDGRYFSDLRYTPWADELTLSFTLAMLEAEEIGQRGHTDYLSISFSATDYVGHAYGPNSLEAEDNVLRLDRILGELFLAVNEAVGLENTLIVLSSDHGVQTAPEFAAEHGIEAGRLGTDAVLEQMNQVMSQRFETGERLVAAFTKPTLYLDYDALERAGVERVVAEKALAEELLRLEGFSHALTRGDLLEGRAPDSPFTQMIHNAFHPGRSGDVYAVTDPFWYISQETGGDAATHGTAHVSDRQVPLMFAGPGIGKATVHRRVAPRDVASTLSAIMGIVPPSGSVGEILFEVMPGSDG